MNRELKFRAWDTGTKQFVDPSSIYIELTGELRGWGGPLSDIEDPSRWIIQQYTGLKDKHGMEIYEKDVCKIKGKNYEYVFEVFWNEETAGFDLSSNDSFYPDYLDWFEIVTKKLDIVEVIGNTLENGDLLK